MNRLTLASPAVRRPQPGCNQPVDFSKGEKMKRLFVLLALVMLVGSSGATAMSLHIAPETISVYAASGTPEGGIRRGPKNNGASDYTCGVSGHTRSGTTHIYNLFHCLLSASTITEAPAGSLVGTITSPTQGVATINLSIATEPTETYGSLTVSAALPNGSNVVRIYGTTIEQPGQPPVFTGQLDVTYEQPPTGPN